MTFALRQLPVYLMGSFIFLAVLMLVELVAENFQIISLKRKVKKAQEEVLHYKAKLYDQAEAGGGDDDDDDEEEDSDDGDDDEDDDR